MKNKWNGFLVLTAALLAPQSRAHVEAGLYVGKTVDGQRCELTSTQTHFLNNTPHPLNERVEVEVAGQAFSLQHPPVISAEKSQASFNHDGFQAIVPTPAGAVALLVSMQHTEGAEGPTGYQLITHEWRADKRSKVDCQGLQLQK